MRLYHITFKHKLPSIKKNGLGGVGKIRNFDFSLKGHQCFATSRDVCMNMLVDMTCQGAYTMDRGARKITKNLIPVILEYDYKALKGRLQEDVNHWRSFQVKGTVKKKHLVRVHELTKREMEQFERNFFSNGYL